ncbi:hypothetical protein LWI28_012452 [Acer negundo]|uniref:Uncharacterized protein n=1 Tax=Acer negundo TaxID=4023 RepID=A0AAD5NVK1_ACENE|nr:hypothetical protein LWI28_012452 [Acer negundo]
MAEERSLEMVPRIINEKLESSSNMISSVRATGSTGLGHKVSQLGQALSRPEKPNMIDSSLGPLFSDADCGRPISTNLVPTKAQSNKKWKRIARRSNTPDQAIQDGKNVRSNNLRENQKRKVSGSADEARVTHGISRPTEASMDMKTRGEEGNVGETTSLRGEVSDRIETSVTENSVSLGSEFVSNMDLSAGRSLLACCSQ